MAARSRGGGGSGAGGPADVVLTERPCGGCGYSLKGLRVGGVCPECGRPIVSSGGGSRRYTDNLADAPIGYLRVLRLGCIGVAGIGALGLMVLVWVGGAGGGWDRVIAGLAAAVVALLWFGVVWCVTTPRGRAETTVRDDVLDSVWLPWVIRGLACGWVLAAMFVVVVGRLEMGAAAGGGGGPAVWGGWAVLALLTSAAGSVGIAALAWWMGALAAWAGDDSLDERLRLCAWAIAAGVVGLLARGALSGFAIPGGLLIIAGAIGKIVVVFTSMEMAQTAGWAIRNHQEADEREVRRAERSARAAAETVVPRIGKAFLEVGERPEPEVKKAEVVKGADRPKAKGGSYNMYRREVSIEPPLGEAGADPYGVVEEDDGKARRHEGT